MEFFPYEPFDKNESQKKVWDWLKEAFKDDLGVAYYRYPIFNRRGRLSREPDILIVHRELGLWVIECKGCYIDNIESIQGHEWKMSNWYGEIETPVAQAEDQMFAIKNKLTERRETRGLLTSFNFRVALPLVKKQDWQSKGFHDFPSTQGVVLVYEELTPKAFKKKLTDDNENRQQKLTDKEWELVKGVLGGTLASRPPRNIPTGTSVDNPIRVIHAIESKLKVLDETQQKTAFEVPNGAQRLRGLAGTGKTVLFAKRAAKIHAAHPDWKIAFIFFTRSLYDQILELISLYYREMTGEEPDWTRLKVIHAWGAVEQDGFYRTLALKCGQKPKTVNDVNNAIGRVSPSDGFEYICECLEHKYPEIPIIYDVILIDEGQDLPPSFYRLAYKTLSDPKRLYWAYDEAQGIGSLIIPESKNIFGRTIDDKPIVDVSGIYEGGIRKTHIINRCYRTPRLLLMTAHAINMGFFRKDGALQGVTEKEDWIDLGYEVIEGNFQKVGLPVTITRSADKSPHPIDQEDFELSGSVGSPLLIQIFDAEYKEREWIAEQVANDIKIGIDPWDIMITALGGDNEKEYLRSLQDTLANYGISSYIAGVDGNPSIFRKDGHVSISNIFRAKGNEAWKVYVCRFHYATQPLDWKGENELHKRNEAFVALTRARVWCVATGLENTVFDELEQAITQYPNFTFPAFNRKSLKRVTEDKADDNTKVANWKTNCPNWLLSC